MAQAQTRQNVLWTARSKVDGVTSMVVFLDALLILFGAALQTGVWTGIFGVIGGSLVFVAVVFRVLLWAYRLFWSHHGESVMHPNEQDYGYHGVE